MIKISINNRNGFTDAEILKHDTACKMLETVLNSIEFKARLLTMKFSGTRKTPSQIYQMIMQGSDELNKTPDGDIDVHVNMYYKNNNTVGYTYPSDINTYVNRKFFKHYDYAEVACNIIHEYAHKMGFGHSSATDYNSVPYAIGYMVRGIIKDMIKGLVLTPIESVPHVGPPVVITPIEIKKKLVCYRPWYWPFIKKCYYVGVV